MACCLVFLCGAARQQDLWVPPDESLLVQEYVQLGVPEPTKPWSASEYRSAVDVLATVSPFALPRLGSAKSGDLFDQLIASYAFFDSVVEPEPRLGSLYGPSRPDGLLFDRELVAIHALRLGAVGERSPTISELAGWAENSEQLARDATLDEARVRHAKTAGQFLSSSSLFSAALVEETQALLALTRIRALGDAARQQVLTAFAPLVAAYHERVVSADLEVVAEAFRSAAQLDCNAGIAVPLEELARAVEAREAADIGAATSR